jgi:hypothetical protein
MKLKLLIRKTIKAVIPVGRKPVDSTRSNGRGNDKGKQYIFYRNLIRLEQFETMVVVQE